MSATHYARRITVAGSALAVLALPVAVAPAAAAPEADRSQAAPVVPTALAPAELVRALDERQELAAASRAQTRPARPSIRKATATIPRREPQSVPAPARSNVNSSPGEKSAPTKTKTRVAKPAVQPRKAKPRQAESRPVARSAGGTRSAAEVVAFARAQLGKPYRYGADGPGAFDCSGLTQAAFRRAGARLPHSSGGQAGRGRRISKAEGRPGDLVVMSGHVGVYIGNGRMIHSPRPGDRVQVSKISWGAWSLRRIV